MQHAYAWFYWNIQREQVKHNQGVNERSWSHEINEIHKRAIIENRIMRSEEKRKTGNIQSSQLANQCEYSSDSKKNSVEKKMHIAQRVTKYWEDFSTFKKVWLEYWTTIKNSICIWINQLVSLHFCISYQHNYHETKTMNSVTMLIFAFIMSKLRKMVVFLTNKQKNYATEKNDGSVSRLNKHLSFAASKGSNEIHLLFWSENKIKWFNVHCALLPFLFTIASMRKLIILTSNKQANKQMNFYKITNKRGKITIDKKSERTSDIR